jgi:hypothetical protein
MLRSLLGLGAASTAAAGTAGSLDPAFGQDSVVPQLWDRPAFSPRSVGSGRWERLHCRWCSIAHSLLTILRGAR